MAQRLLVVLKNRVSELDGPMVKQVSTLEFFLASVLKGKTDEEIAVVLRLVIDTMHEVLSTPIELTEELQEWLEDEITTPEDVDTLIAAAHEKARASLDPVDLPNEQ